MAPRPRNSKFKERVKRVRRRKPPLETSGAIVTVAQELMGPDGNRAFTLQDVARRLSISRSTINHHFATKKDLIAAAQSKRV